MENVCGAVVLALGVGLQRIGLDDDGIAVGEIEHEERPGVHELRRDRVDLRRARAIEQEGCVVAPVVEDTIEHEAGDIGGDQRHLARHAKDPVEIVQQSRIGAGPADHLDNGIAPRRREEMSHRRPLFVTQAGEDALGRERARVGGDHHLRRNDLLDTREDLALERNRFGSRLDNPIGISCDGVVERHVQVLHDLLGLCGAELAALHAFLCVALEPLDGAIERGLGHVDQMKRQVGKGGLEVIADVRPNSACPDDHHAFGQSP